MTAGPQNNDISGASVPVVQDSSKQSMKLLATVLVFANAAIKFQERHVRIVSFYFSIAVFATSLFA